jgi:hypothetical protein
MEFITVEIHPEALLRVEASLKLDGRRTQHPCAILLLAVGAVGNSKSLHTPGTVWVEMRIPWP